ncbi:hypothetical protein B0H16DRAFT_1822099 [Mycena metata]|uniref:Uncharacterized protein n=1 Tax=Mycena metata TaxID=1033252 RepID=A0AAD7H050_9AGAR|nr:hypothetical protein B0H16DRAFT_1822096 [Mycena metata]KAJ7709223.1 hypothetical protein B0H16DRAFT_1822099 [Mycena metata]
MSVASLCSTPPVLSPKSRGIFDNDPEHVLDLALSRLQAVGIKLVEWRDLVDKRMGVPACIKNYSYLVPDALLPHASHVLTNLGLPFAPPTTFEISMYGDFAARGHSHRITHSIQSRRVQHLVIYPQSFATLGDSEFEEGPPSHLRSPRCAPVLVPTAPAVYASILRMMLQYDEFDPTTGVLQSQLSELIGYHLFELSDGYIDTGDDEECARWDVDRRVSDAVCVVLAWGVDEVWRDGEEWMGDALAEVVRTGHTEHLPHKLPEQ